MRLVSLLALMPACEAWCVGPTLRAFPRASVSQHTHGKRHATSVLMGRWSAEDMASKRRPLPEEVEAILSDDTPREEVKILWCALFSVFGNEEDAIAAAIRSPTTILPYVRFLQCCSCP